VTGIGRGIRLNGLETSEMRRGRCLGFETGSSKLRVRTRRSSRTEITTDNEFKRNKN